MNELQAGIEFSFAVFPESSVFLQPGKAALDNPALGHDLEGVQLAAFGNLHGDMLTQNIAYALRKRLAHIAAIAQNTLHLAHALCIYKQERAASVAPLSRARRAKLIFLTPAPAG